MVSSGDQFFRGAIISATAGVAGPTNPVHNLCHLLLDSSCLRKEECRGNQREVFTRNRNGTSSS